VLLQQELLVLLDRFLYQEHLNNTTSIPVSIPVYNQRGEISNMRQTNMQGRVMDTDEIN